MQAIGYYLALPFLYAISILPFWVLHGISNLLAFLLHSVFRYRRKVVDTNLLNAFPNLSAKQRYIIGFRFYINFTDVTLETIKLLTISKKDLQNRVSFPNNSLMEKFYNEGKSIIFCIGHYGNWEMIGLFLPLTKLHSLDIVYHPLHNPFFNNFFIKLRARTGNRLVAMRDVLRVSNLLDNNPRALGLAADQAPPPESAHWMQFLNQPTGVFNGAEKLSKRRNLPVIYFCAKSFKRGYYQLNETLISSNPLDTAKGEITTQFMRLLEQDIKQLPHLWLWTHKRWKHKPPKDYIPQ